VQAVLRDEVNRPAEEFSRFACRAELWDVYPAQRLYIPVQRDAVVQTLMTQVRRTQQNGLMTRTACRWVMSPAG
jgi:hypothetical protein